MLDTSSYVKRKTFKAGKIIFKEGDIRENAYILEAGEIQIIRGDIHDKANIMATLSEGDLFGEMALIEPGLRSATAMVTEDCVIYMISPDLLEERLKGLDPIVMSIFTRLVEGYRFGRIEKDKSGDLFRKFLMQEQAEETKKALSVFSSKKSEFLKELAMEQEVRRALSERHFQPYLQPIVSLSDNQIIGFETLIRWHHPEKGMIMPDSFIPVAERMNLIQAIDRQMLEMACEVIPKMARVVKNNSLPFISVNLSGVNFEDNSMVLGIAEVLNAADINPANIKLEITESAFIGNADKAAKILEGLKKLGVTIALDDFGVGYSSLGYLHKFAIDGIKIDRSFTKRARDNRKGMDIVEAIVNLAKTFDLGVIAEGIETKDDVDALTKIGCVEGQGYLFGKPLTIDDALSLLSH
jgi:EAL domain-containing protein (putative c-di-GMP-specific phosphodiesterase class I)